MFSNLNELARKLSLDIFPWNAKVEPMSTVKREFQIGQIELLTVLVSKVMDSCQYIIN